MSAPRRRRDARGAIYVHVPFCARVCPYCDFAVTASARFGHADYADALIAELDARAPAALAGRDVRTIYVGGGTPSRMEWRQLERVLDRARALAGPGVVEVTMEANPSDVTAEAMAAWEAGGVTRVSLGCQSFEDETLRALGRNHDGEGARRAAAALAARGGLSVSVDLIFGSPGQTLGSLRRDAEFAAGLEGLGHVSAYNLTIEEGTPFARRAARGELGEASEDACVEMLELLEGVLGEAGFARYEVSSFAREGARSQHNTNYWIGGEYLGVGVGAHGLEVGGRGVVRRANTRHVKRYLEDPLGSGEVELLGPREHLLERAFVAVRSRVGLDWSELTWQFGGVEDEALDALEGALDGLAREGLLEVAQGERVWRPTRRGWLYADALAERLWAAVEG